MVHTDIDATEAGFDPTRLDRITSHLQGYVDRGLIPGFSVAISRGAHVPFVTTGGQRDLETGAPMQTETVVRLYSMTKAIVSVAAMVLYEEGRLDITDPVSRYIPAFGDTRVYLRGPATNPATAPQQAPMTVQHLLSHTAGLTYGFVYASGMDHLYRQAGFEWGTPKGLDLAGCCERWAAIPLLFQPGEEWAYSVATDVLGRVVEVVSGMPLDQYLETAVLGPLGMGETRFGCREDQLDRLAALYVPGPGDRKAVRMDAMGDAAKSTPVCLSGGGGLVGTLGDYLRFTRMLQGGGVLDGVRILSPRTIRFMASNHLPGGRDLSEVGRPLFSETNYEGTGFGLGFSVVTDPVKTRSLCSLGEFAWGGAASTAFWVDPVEELSVVFLTQLLPSSTWPLRAELRRLIYSALL
jgi:CubicO group peptidase (beta-lactamase class C family)